MADFQFNPETGEYEYVGTGYDGAPDEDAAPASAPFTFEREYVNPNAIQNQQLEAEQAAEAEHCRQQR